MAGIFISYRRADSDGWAGRLRDALGFGHELGERDQADVREASARGECPAGQVDGLKSQAFSHFRNERVEHTGDRERTARPRLAERATR